MGQSLAIPRVIPNDWKRLDLIINKIKFNLGRQSSPTFTGIELGHVDDTTITRASAGNLNIEGNLVYRAGGIDIPIVDGGTGRSTAQAAIDALSVVGAATNEHVLTKDTATGNAKWKAAAGGVVGTLVPEYGAIEFTL